MAERISRPNSKVFTLQGYGGMPEVLQDFQVMDSPAEMAAALASAPPVPGLASYTASASATPPPTTTYQVGITNNFAGNTNAPQLSSKSGIKATVPATGTISLGYMYIDGLGPTAGDIQTIICVYSDSGANTPQTLLGYSDTVTIPDNSAIAWRPYTFSTPITISNTNPIWLAILDDTGNAQLGFEFPSSTTGIFSNLGSDPFAGGPETPWNMGQSTVFGGAYSIYVELVG